MEQLEDFVYLGSMFTRDEMFDKDWRRVQKGNSVNGGRSYKYTETKLQCSL